MRIDEICKFGLGRLEHPTNLEASKAKTLRRATRRAASCQWNRPWFGLSVTGGHSHGPHRGKDLNAGSTQRLQLAASFCDSPLGSDILGLPVSNARPTCQQVEGQHATCRAWDRSYPGGHCIPRNHGGARLQRPGHFQGRCCWRPHMVRASFKRELLSRCSAVLALPRHMKHRRTRKLVVLVGLFLPFPTARAQLLGVLVRNS